MKTIFVFIYGYIPSIGYGGPVTSIKNFSDHFGDKYDIRIVTSNHDHDCRETLKNIKVGWNKVGKANVMYLSERDYTFKKFYGLISEYDVTMVYLTGVFPIQINKPAIDASRRLNIPVLIATRGEICRNILAMKRWKKIPYLKLMKSIRYFKGCKFQVTSDEEREQLKKYLNIPDKDIIMLSNLHSRKYDIPNPTKESGSAKLIFISRIHPKKNLYDAILAVNQVPDNIQFDIYGPVEDYKYWEKCQNAIDMAPSNIKISYCGALTMEEARMSYYNYHGFLFPTLSENYGHVIVEAMIAGCVPIISNGTTPWDDLDDNGGYVAKLHDANELSKVIHKFALMTQCEYDKEKDKLQKYVNNKLKTSELIAAYDEMIKSL